MVLVIPAVATPFDGLELRELLLPIPQHMWLDRTQIAYLADREITLGGDLRQFGFTVSVLGHGSRLRPLPSVSGLHERSRRAARLSGFPHRSSDFGPVFEAFLEVESCRSPTT